MIGGEGEQTLPIMVRMGFVKEEVGRNHLAGKSCSARVVDFLGCLNNIVAPSSQRVHL